MQALSQGQRTLTTGLLARHRRYRLIREARSTRSTPGRLWLLTQTPKLNDENFQSYSNPSLGTVISPIIRLTATHYGRSELADASSNTTEEGFASSTYTGPFLGLDRAPHYIISNSLNGLGCVH